MTDFRHHYIPCFYTKRWLDNGGKIRCHSYQRDNLKLGLWSPKGTGCTCFSISSKVKCVRWVNNWVAKNSYLFKVINQTQWEVRAYSPEYELERIAYISNPYFLSNNPSQHKLSLVFISKSLASTKQLNKPYLSSMFEGPIPTYDVANEKKYEFEVKNSYFPLYF